MSAWGRLGRLTVWSVGGALAAAVAAGLAWLSYDPLSPNFDAMLAGTCTAGRLPGSPGSGILVALLLGAAVGGLAVSRPRARLSAFFAAGCGPLVYGAVEGWMSWCAVLLQVLALFAFAQEQRRTSWILGVLAAWVWPPSLLILVALAVGEVDRARHRGAGWTGGLITALAPATFALAAALPAWLMRRDTFLPVQSERGLSGVAQLVAEWTRAWPQEVSARAIFTSGVGEVLALLQLLGLGLLMGVGLVRVLQRARHHEGYAAIRLALGLGLWTLLLGGWMGLGRGSWGSTQGLLHVSAVLLLIEGSVEWVAMPRWRPLALGVIAWVGVGWSLGLYHVARQWVATSPFLH
jgi:hypothetical protein